MRTVLLASLVCIPALVAPGCARLRVEPVEVEVKPIHVTVDVNLRVQRELDDVFGGIDRRDPTVKAAAK